MNRLQKITWLVAALIWAVFMGPRLSVLQAEDPATSRSALITLCVFSVVVLVSAGVVTWLLRARPEPIDAPRQRPRPAPTTRRLQDRSATDGDGTRATDLLGPGNAAQRAARQAARRRDRRVG